VAASNLLKRNYAYYWRRSLVVEGDPMPITLSLHTKAPAVARRRGALMTARSEDIRVSLYERIKSEGLAPRERWSIFRSEMVAYRNALVHESVRWEASAELNEVVDTTSSLRIFRELWGHVAADGFPAQAIDDDYIRQHLPELEPLERQGLATAIAGLASFRSAFVSEVADRLAQTGIGVTDQRLTMAARVVAAARTQAAHDCINGIAANPLIDLPVNGVTPADYSSALSVAPFTPAEPLAAPAVAPSLGSTILPPGPWATMTAHDIATLIIETRPELFAHRASGKRASQQTGEQTKRQILWAARLFDRSRAGRPFWQRTRQDVVELDKWFEHLPVNIGKSPRHHQPDVSLEMIREEALKRIEEGDMDAADIGFMAGTTNKHFRFLAQIDKEAVKNIPGLAPVGFTEFCTPDIKDEREARLRISNEQAEAIFRLPPWTGCAGVDHRLEAGASILHDGLFWVLLLVWYTGARREEICKLMVVDVACRGGTWYLTIQTTVTGRVKNTSAFRVIAICDALIRLGFAEYVQAMKEAGEALLFPELMPNASTKRKLGDVFYKLCGWTLPPKRRRTFWESSRSGSNPSATRRTSIFLQPMTATCGVSAWRRSPRCAMRFGQAPLPSFTSTPRSWSSTPSVS
jgi:integrase